MSAFQSTIVKTAPGRALLQLRAALRDGPLSEALRAGRVPVAGCSLVPGDAAAADIREMPLAELVLDAAAGNTWLGIPVFTNRRVFHTLLAVAQSSPVRQPQDLRNRTVGAVAPAHDATLWTRGVLQDRFGLALDDVRWHFDADPQRLVEAAASGEIEAVLLPEVPTGFRPLFVDAKAEAARYVSETGLYPIASVLAVRRTVYDAYPWVALNLFSAFLKAGDAARQEALPWLDTFFEAGLVDRPARNMLPDWPLRHGLKAPREIETLLDHAVAQHVLRKPLKIADIFAHDTLDV